MMSGITVNKSVVVDVDIPISPRELIAALCSDRTPDSRQTYIDLVTRLWVSMLACPDEFIAALEPQQRANIYAGMQHQAARFAPVDAKS